MVLERIGRGAIDIFIFEAAHAGELRLAEPIKQELEVFVGLAGEADDESRADGEVWTDVTPERDALQGLLLVRWPPHGSEHVGARMLEGNVEIRKHTTLRHQREHLIDMRIRIDVVEPYPRAERAEPLGESDEPRVALFSAPCALGIAEIEPISARVLRDDEQLLYAGGDQPLGLAHHLAEQEALEPAAQRRNDAEAAGVVAALRNFQIGVVARRKLDTLGGKRSRKGSCGRGTALCTSSTTASYWCGPVMASTSG
jgi:hypothetical protein